MDSLTSSSALHGLFKCALLTRCRRAGLVDEDSDEETAVLAIVPCSSGRTKVEAGKLEDNYGHPFSAEGWWEAVLEPALFEVDHAKSDKEVGDPVLERQACTGSSESVPDAILSSVIDFAIAAPKAYVQIRCICKSMMQSEIGLAEDRTWRRLFGIRWPAFQECLLHQGKGGWRALYQEMLAGRLRCTLEVYNRSKIDGFVMSAMPGTVHYEKSSDAYVVQYISSRRVPPERVPASENCRLRLCPALVEGGLSAPGSEQAGTSYPHQVLGCPSSLRPGQMVELQWKMSEMSPFGWWYARVEAIEPRCSSSWESRVVLNFLQFPESSQWHRMEVCIGGSQPRPCSKGGYTGGLRVLSEGDVKQWSPFVVSKPFNV